MWNIATSKAERGLRGGRDFCVLRCVPVLHKNNKWFLFFVRVDFYEKYTHIYIYSSWYIINTPNCTYRTCTWYYVVQGIMFVTRVDDAAVEWGARGVQVQRGCRVAPKLTTRRGEFDLPRTASCLILLYTYMICYARVGFFQNFFIFFSFLPTCRAYNTNNNTTLLWCQTLSWRNDRSNGVVFKFFCLWIVLSFGVTASLSRVINTHHYRQLSDTVIGTYQISSPSKSIDECTIPIMYKTYTVLCVFWLTFVFSNHSSRVPCVTFKQI